MTTTAKPNMTVALLERANTFLPKNEASGPRTWALTAVKLAYDEYRRTEHQVTFDNLMQARTCIQAIRTETGRPLSARDFLQRAAVRAKQLAADTLPEIKPRKKA